ncbi:MAG: DUF4143 domain-containing protein, partial [Bacteroidales bacterium]|nr:DUF4143 domain-containing protein [Bacteroidales bacterium]
LGLERFEDIYRHPAFGAVWEQIVLSNLKGLFPKAEFYFYRTSHGAEIDFVMVFKGQVIAIECKASAVPSLSQGNYNAIEDIRPVHTFVITQTLEKRFPLKEGIDVLGIGEIKTAVENLLFG